MIARETDTGAETQGETEMSAENIADRVNRSNARGEWCDAHAARVQAAEAGIVLYASQFADIYTRLPRWGDAGVLAVARIAAYAHQECNGEELVPFVMSRLGNYAQSNSEHADLIAALVDIPDWDNIAAFEALMS